MKVPTTGPISFEHLRDSFRDTNPISFNEFYAGGAKVPSGATGMYGALPTTGALSMLKYRGAGLSTLGDGSAPMWSVNPSGEAVTGVAMDLFGTIMLRARGYTMVSYDGGLTFNTVSLDSASQAIATHTNPRLQHFNGNWYYVFQSGNTIYTQRSVDEGATWSLLAAHEYWSWTHTIFLGPTNNDYTTQTDYRSYSLLPSSSDLAPGPMSYYYTEVYKQYGALANYGGLSSTTYTTTYQAWTEDGLTVTDVQQAKFIDYSYKADTGSLWSESQRAVYAYNPLVGARIRLVSSTLQYSYDGVAWTTTQLKPAVGGVAYPSTGKIFYDVYLQKLVHVSLFVYSFNGGTFSWTPTEGLVIHVSDDGQTWSELCVSTDAKLTGLSHVAMYGTNIIGWKSTNNSYVASTDNGATWTDSLVSGSAVAPMIRPLLTDKCLLIVGASASIGRVLV